MPSDWVIAVTTWRVVEDRAAPYVQAGAPAVVAGATAAWCRNIAHVTVVMFAFVAVAFHPPPERIGPPSVSSCVVQHVPAPAVGGVVHATGTRPRDAGATTSARRVGSDSATLPG
jgi:hypothetical protein